MLQKGDQKKNTSNSTPKSLDVKVILSLFFNFHSKISRVKNMAENKDVRIPIINVVAKPLMGPVPKR